MSGLFGFGIEFTVWLIKHLRLLPHSVAALDSTALQQWLLVGVGRLLDRFANPLRSEARPDWHFHFGSGIHHFDLSCPKCIINLLKLVVFMKKIYETICPFRWTFMIMGQPFRCWYVKLTCERFDWFDPWDGRDWFPWLELLELLRMLLLLPCARRS